MSRWFLALPVLLIAAGLASANYILIIVNLGEQTEWLVDKSAGGRTGGALGMAGGALGAGGGAVGAVGAAGAVGGQAGQLGALGQLGAAGQLGALGQLGGGRRRTKPPPAEMIFDPDAAPLHIVAVVETKPLVPGSPRFKLFEQANSQTAITITLPIKHKWGDSSIVARSKVHTASVVRVDGKLLKNLKARFADKFNPQRPDTKPNSSEKFTADQLADIAEWALSHGLAGKDDHVAQVLDKLSELDPKHPAAGPYLKVKAGLAKALPRGEVSSALRSRIGGSFKIVESPHYILLHDLSADSPQVRNRLDLLEQGFRSFYYWFALRGINPLPEMPREKMPVVLTNNEKEFDRLYDQLMVGQLVAGVAGADVPKEPAGGLGGLGGLGAGMGAKAVKPLVISDGFFDRRDNLVVFSSKRLDELYDALEKHTRPFWQSGYDRHLILKGRKQGIPRTGANEDTLAQAQSCALVFKVMEEDSEVASSSHEVPRQLLYGSGLLSRNVLTPEWVEFGMGSFFETSPGSPWPTIGAVNHAYMTPFKAMLKLKKLERTPVETLRAVITDQYFRRVPASADRQAAARKARAAAWSLTFFLAQKKLDGWLRFFKELGKMPRDLELSDDMLLGAFARAFDCVDAAKKVDNRKLMSLANQWYLFIDTTDVEPEMQAVQSIIQNKVTEYAKEKEKDKKTPKP